MDYMTFTMKGWAMRDGDSKAHVWFYDSEPRRLPQPKVWAPKYTEGRTWTKLPFIAFPEITWEDEPAKVTLTIERR